MKFKKTLLFIGTSILLILIALFIYLYPFYKFFFNDTSIVIDERLTLITGAGNSCLLETDSAIVVVDTKMGKMGERLSQKAKDKAGKRKIIVINTHFHGDHIYGNRYFKNCPIYIGPYTVDLVGKNIQKEDFPTDYVKDSLTLKLGDEILHLYSIGQAHTFADLVVWMEKRKILVTGDLVFNKINPALIKEDGSDVNKWIKALDGLFVNRSCEAVIPGHGELGGTEIINEMKQYFIDMKSAAGNSDRIKQIKLKYKEWMNMPLMASTGRTIDFIKENHD